MPVCGCGVPVSQVDWVSKNIFLFAIATLYVYTSVCLFVIYSLSTVSRLFGQSRVSRKPYLCRFDKYQYLHSFVH